MIIMKKNLLFLPLFVMFALSACSTSLVNDSETTPGSSGDNPSSQPDEEPSTDDDGQSQDDTITLRWGERTDFGDDIEGIKFGENVRAGAVSLVASSNYEGTFSISLSDATTVAKGSEDAKLVDYLIVNVYEGNVNLTPNKTLPSGTVKLSISRETAQTQSFNVVGTPAGVDYTIFVSLRADAVLKQPELAQDIVSLEVNWNQA